jgi:hypothetical protein
VIETYEVSAAEGALSDPLERDPPPELKNQAETRQNP